MKLKYIVIFCCASLLSVSCSNDNEPGNNGEVGISRITASDQDASGLRTTLDGYGVTWAASDALGCIKTTDPSSNNHFVLDKGAGTRYGMFNAVAQKDHLTAGTWRAYYPFSATKYTAAKKFRIVNMNQMDDTPAHVAQYDWLISDPVALTAGKPDANFKMNHAFALVEFNVKLKNETLDYTELAQCVLESADGSSIFAQNVYFDNQGEIQFDFTSRNVSVMRSPYVEFTTQNHTLWLLVRQSELKPLTVRVYFIHGPISSASATFTPTSILEPGKKYVLNLEMEINESNPNASTLTILSRS